MTRLVRLLAALFILGGLPGCPPMDRAFVLELHGDVDRDAERIEVFVHAIDAPANGTDVDPPSSLDCDELLSLADPLDLPPATRTLEFAPWAPMDLGRLDDGWYLVHARAWTPDCRIAERCVEVQVGVDVEVEVRLALTELSEPLTCPDGQRCSEAACVSCGSCCSDVECNDRDPNTTDSCVDGLCRHRRDHDGDGFDGPTDCDDRLEEVHPGAIPLDGAALDRDCDGDVDARDGSGVPFCWLGVVEDQLRRRDLHAWAVEAVGDILVAAVGDEAGSELWLGQVLPGRLEELGAVALAGTEDAPRGPRDLALLRDMAIVLGPGGRRLHIINISTPTAPRELPILSLDREAERLELTPPVIWTVGPDGHAAFDASQISPAHGWPASLASVPDFEPDALRMHERHGTRVFLDGSTQLTCAVPRSPVDVSAVREECFDTAWWAWAAAVPTLELTMSADRELFLATGAGFDNGGGAVGALLWRVPIGVDGLPVAATTSAAWAHGEPTFLAVQGGTILRGTDEGLYLHRRAGFTFDAETWTRLDVEADETPGPPVLDATLVGRTAIVAAGEEGVVVASLECR